MTYKELAEKIAKMSEDQQNQPVTIVLVNEGYEVCMSAKSCRMADNLCESLAEDRVVLVAR